MSVDCLGNCHTIHISSLELVIYTDLLCKQVLALDIGVETVLFLYVFAYLCNVY
jgi:hypothetical protein